MARIISTYTKKKNSRHHVLNFALTHSVNGVVEWLVLRFFEAFKILNRSAIQFLKKELFSQEGHAYKSKDHKIIVYLLYMRNEYIAHRINNIHQDSGTFKKVNEEYGTIFDFLNGIMDLIEEKIEDLECLNVFEGIKNLPSSCPVVKEFTENELKQLIEVANALVADKKTN